jgi:hypothetical protein
MKIASYQVTTLSVPEDDPLANMPEEAGRKRPIVILRLRTDDGADAPAPRGNVALVGIDDLAVATFVLEVAAALGGGVLEFHLHQPSLQDVFIELTGRALRD